MDERKTNQDLSEKWQQLHGIPGHHGFGLWSVWCGFICSYILRIGQLFLPSISPLLPPFVQSAQSNLSQQQQTAITLTSSPPPPTRSGQVFIIFPTKDMHKLLTWFLTTWFFINSTKTKLIVLSMRKPSCEPPFRDYIMLPQKRNFLWEFTLIIFWKKVHFHLSDSMNTTDWTFLKSFVYN